MLWIFNDFIKITLMPSMDNWDWKTNEPFEANALITQNHFIIMNLNPFLKRNIQSIHKLSWEKNSSCFAAVTKKSSIQYFLISPMYRITHYRLRQSAAKQPATKYRLFWNIQPFQEPFDFTIYSFCPYNNIWPSIRSRIVDSEHEGLFLSFSFHTEFYRLA